MLFENSSQIEVQSFLKQQIFTRFANRLGFISIFIARQERPNLLEASVIGSSTLPHGRSWVSQETEKKQESGLDTYLVLEPTPEDEIMKLLLESAVDPNTGIVYHPQRHPVPMEDST